MIIPWKPWNWLRRKVIRRQPIRRQAVAIGLEFLESRNSPGSMLTMASALPALAGLGDFFSSANSAPAAAGLSPFTDIVPLSVTNQVPNLFSSDSGSSSPTAGLHSSAVTDAGAGDSSGGSAAGSILPSGALTGSVDASAGSSSGMAATSSANTSSSTGGPAATGSASASLSGDGEATASTSSSSSSTATIAPAPTTSSNTAPGSSGEALASAGSSTAAGSPTAGATTAGSTGSAGAAPSAQNTAQLSQDGFSSLANLQGGYSDLGTGLGDSSVFITPTSGGSSADAFGPLAALRGGLGSHGSAGAAASVASGTAFVSAQGGAVNVNGATTGAGTILAAPQADGSGAFAAGADGLLVSALSNATSASGVGLNQPAVSAAQASGGLPLYVLHGGTFVPYFQPSADGSVPTGGFSLVATAANSSSSALINQSARFGINSGQVVPALGVDQGGSNTFGTQQSGGDATSSFALTQTVNSTYAVHEAPSPYTATTSSTPTTPPPSSSTAPASVPAATAMITPVAAGATSTTTLTSSVGTASYGQAVTLSVNVSGASGLGTPTGTVTLSDGSTTLGTLTLTNGTGSLTTSALSIGSHGIRALYSGDSTFAGGGAALSQMVNPATTALTLTSSPAGTGAYGQSVTLTAVVAVQGPGSGLPTGTITFFDSGTALGTGTLANVNGQAQASLKVSNLAGGSHALSASYAGSTAYQASSAALTQAVTPAGSSISLSSSATNTAPGQSVTLTATVSSSAGTPTGTVTFTDGSTTLATVALSGGSASFTSTILSTGSHSITASYSGSSGFSAATSAAVSQTVAQAATTTALSSSNSSSTQGQGVTFTATVSSSNTGAGTPTGSVTFKDGSTTLATVALSGGKATYATALLSLGTHSITAVYGGSSVFTGNTSAVLSQTVNTNNNEPTAKTATFTQLATSAATVNPGQSVTLTANVSSINGTPGGNVTFYDGSTSLGTAALSSGKATLTTSSLSGGSHSLTATYAGSASFYSSTSAALSQTVGWATTTALTTSLPSGSVFGQAVLLTATVAPQGTTTNPTGTVTFYDGAASLGSATLSTAGGVTTASLTVSSLGVGSHGLTASYGGASSFLSSGSASVAQPVSLSGSTTTLAVTPASGASSGQQVTLTASVAAAGLGGGTPTGAVVFTDGGVVLGSGTLSVVNGVAQASLSTSALVAGSHSLAAQYGGDSGFSSSGSAASTATVSATTTAVSVSAGQTGSTASGQPATFVATITPQAGTGTPTGTVTFSEGGVALGTATLAVINGLAQASFTTSALAAGNHLISASYSGDSNYQSASGSALSWMVNAATTSINLSSSSGTILAGKSVTLTSTVSVTGAGAGLPSGSVTFLDGNTVLGSVPLSVVNGVAQAGLLVPTLSAGQHILTASYGGAAATAASTSAALTQTVNQANTTTALAASSTSPVVGQTLTLTATVAPSYPTGPTGMTDGGGSTSTSSGPVGVPTGTVVFSDGGVVLGAATLVGGVATFATSSLLAGSHSLSATYQGSGDYYSSASSGVSLYNRYTTTTTLNSPLGPGGITVQGQSLTFTATALCNDPNGGMPSGNVNFSDGGTVVATVALVNGVATWTTTSLGLGNHTITASYVGDGAHGASDSTSSGTSSNFLVNPTTGTYTLTATLDMVFELARNEGALGFSSDLLGTYVLTLTQSGTYNAGVFSVNTFSLDGTGTESFQISQQPTTGSNISLTAQGNDTLTLHESGSGSSLSSYSVDKTGTESFSLTRGNTTAGGGYSMAVSGNDTYGVRARGLASGAAPVAPDGSEVAVLHNAGLDVSLLQVTRSGNESTTLTAWGGSGSGATPDSYTLTASSALNFGTANDALDVAAGLHLATSSLDATGTESYVLTQSGQNGAASGVPGTAGESASSYTLTASGSDAVQLGLLRTEGAGSFNLAASTLDTPDVQAFLGASDLQAQGNYALDSLTLTRTGTETYHLDQTVTTAAPAAGSGGPVAVTDGGPQVNGGTHEVTDGSDHFVASDLQDGGGGSFVLSGTATDGSTPLPGVSVQGGLSLESTGLTQTGSESFTRTDWGSRTLPGSFESFTRTAQGLFSFTRGTATLYADGNLTSSTGLAGSGHAALQSYSEDASGTESFTLLQAGNKSQGSGGSQTTSGYVLSDSGHDQFGRQTLLVQTDDGNGPNDFSLASAGGMAAASVSGSVHLAQVDLSKVGSESFSLTDWNNFICASSDGGPSQQYSQAISTLRQGTDQFSQQEHLLDSSGAFQGGGVSTTGALRLASVQRSDSGSEDFTVNESGTQSSIGTVTLTGQYQNNQGSFSVSGGGHDNFTRQSLGVMADGGVAANGTIAGAAASVAFAGPQPTTVQAQGQYSYYEQTRTDRGNESEQESLGTTQTQVGPASDGNVGASENSTDTNQASQNINVTAFATQQHRLDTSGSGSGGGVSVGGTSHEQDFTQDLSATTSSSASENGQDAVTDPSGGPGGLGSSTAETFSLGQTGSSQVTEHSSGKASSGGGTSSLSVQANGAQNFSSNGSVSDQFHYEDGTGSSQDSSLSENSSQSGSESFSQQGSGTPGVTLGQPGGDWLGSNGGLTLSQTSSGSETGMLGETSSSSWTTLDPKTGSTDSGTQTSLLQQGSGSTFSAQQTTQQQGQQSKVLTSVQDASGFQTFTLNSSGSDTWHSVTPAAPAGALTDGGVASSTGLGSGASVVDDGTDVSSQLQSGTESTTTHEEGGTGSNGVYAIGDFNASDSGTSSYTLDDQSTDSQTAQQAGGSWNSSTDSQTLHDEGNQGFNLTQAGSGSTDASISLSQSTESDSSTDTYTSSDQSTACWHTQGSDGISGDDGSDSQSSSTSGTDQATSQAQGHDDGNGKFLLDQYSSAEQGNSSFTLADSSSDTTTTNSSGSTDVQSDNANLGRTGTDSFSSSIQGHGDDVTFHLDSSTYAEQGSESMTLADTSTDAYYNVTLPPATASGMGGPVAVTDNSGERPGSWHDGGSTTVTDSVASDSFSLSQQGGEVDGAFLTSLESETASGTESFHLTKDAQETYHKVTDDQGSTQDGNINQGLDKTGADSYALSKNGAAVAGVFQISGLSLHQQGSETYSSGGVEDKSWMLYPDKLGSWESGTGHLEQSVGDGADSFTLDQTQIGASTGGQGVNIVTDQTGKQDDESSTTDLHRTWYTVFDNNGSTENGTQDVTQEGGGSDSFHLHLERAGDGSNGLQSVELEQGGNHSYTADSDGTKTYTLYNLSGQLADSGNRSEDIHRQGDGTFSLNEDGSQATAAADPAGSWTGTLTTTQTQASTEDLTASITGHDDKWDYSTDPATNAAKTTETVSDLIADKGGSGDRSQTQTSVQVDGGQPSNRVILDTSDDETATMTLTSDATSTVALAGAPPASTEHDHQVLEKTTTGTVTVHDESSGAVGNPSMQLMVDGGGTSGDGGDDSVEVVSADGTLLNLGTRKLSKDESGSESFTLSDTDTKSSGDPSQVATKGFKTTTLTTDKDGNDSFTLTTTGTADPITGRLQSTVVGQSGGDESFTRDTVTTQYTPEIFNTAGGKLNTTSVFKDGNDSFTLDRTDVLDGRMPVSWSLTVTASGNESYTIGMDSQEGVAPPAVLIISGAAPASSTSSGGTTSSGAGSTTGGSGPTDTSTSTSSSLPLDPGSLPTDATAASTAASSGSADPGTTSTGASASSASTASGAAGAALLGAGGTANILNPLNFGIAVDGGPAQFQGRQSTTGESLYTITGLDSFTTTQTGDWVAGSPPPRGSRPWT